MRPEHYLNYGYTPTCQAALKRLAGLFAPAEGAQSEGYSSSNPAEDKQGIVRLFDPCAGEGQALAYLAESLTTNAASVETYGVEIEAGRANTAGERLDHVLQGDFRRTAVSHRSMSLALLNPPYSNTGGEQSLDVT